MKKRTDMKKTTPFIPANAICLRCGTTKEHPETGYCKNGHDDWLEAKDEGHRFDWAMKKFKVSVHVILKSIANNIDLPVKKYSRKK